MLPAFGHASRNSRLVALVSDDRTKPRRSRASTVSSATYSYESFQDCLEHVDAVYIALPNSLHAEYTITRGACRRARAVREADGRHRGGVPADDRRVPRQPRQADDRVSAALRRDQPRSVDLVRRGRIGEPKFFNSSFSMTVRRGDIRTKKAMRRRDAVRHRRVLHQRRPRPVPQRAEGSDRHVGQQRRREAQRDRRVNRRAAALRRRAGRRLRHQLQRRPTSRPTGSSDEGPAATSIPAYQYAKGSVRADRQRQDHDVSASASAISSRQSCCTSPTASSRIVRRNRRAKKACRTSGSSRRSTSRPKPGRWFRFHPTRRSSTDRTTEDHAPRNQEAESRQGAERECRLTIEPGTSRVASAEHGDADGRRSKELRPAPSTVP